MLKTHLALLKAKGANLGQNKIKLGEAIESYLQGRLYLSSILRGSDLVIKNKNILIM